MQARRERIGEAGSQRELKEGEEEKRSRKGGEEDSRGQLHNKPQSKKKGI